jgi:hypothetical protein
MNKPDQSTENALAALFLISPFVVWGVSAVLLVLLFVL